ncbi:MAG: riboflavin synthase [Methanobacteriota archaeon]|nr:MAG: riboflavin synthase [Euryarchaeota archaeon]|tara:strand:+ start:1109 stop:1711 length:603 start_codon:yes stop_codon:yes gene_type:complete
MFTGIVLGTAAVVGVSEEESFRRISIDLRNYSEGLEIGASVALDGVCMTVVSIDGDVVSFEAIGETTDRTTLGDLVRGSLVNIERSLKVGDELGGHILSGHVMTTAKIVSIKGRGGGLDMQVESPSDIRQFIMEKGYIAVDGMSLTIGKVLEDRFALHIIPETIRATTIGSKVEGDKVNLEIDSKTQAVVETMLRMEGRE